MGGALPAAAGGKVWGDGLAAEGRFRALSLLADARDTPHAARQMAVGTLIAWDLPGIADEVELCVSELVTNAVLHAIVGRHLCEPGYRPTITLTLRAWPRWLFIDVMDEDPSPPTLPIGDGFGPELAEGVPEALILDHGRGLGIVRELADQVWWMPDGDGGKSVFCRFDLEPVRS
ncbi:ATP-binding protein [Phaeacidiphilus oryzae]|uniref:ATP-binding protein n=1 Tax=Phaeacidiphilus oryzae TaxID=348818 RepID=UPI00068FB84A|nr:ATP-binding protein [Phaeacidiphilus oryzae]